MNEKLVERIENNPHYQELLEKRSGFALKLSLFVLAIFYAFILTIAFNPSALGARIGEGVMTIAFPVAATIIVVSFITTLIYVSRANSEFDDLTEKVREDVKDEL